MSVSEPSIDTRFESALADHQAGRLAEAEGAYRRLLADEPAHANSLHLLGVIHHQTGRHADALDLIRRAIALNGADAAYHSNLGVVLHHLRRPAEAEPSYREALRLRPTLVDALNNLGPVLTDLGRPAEAETILRKALRLRPDFADAHSNLSVALAALGRAEEAEASAREALRLRPDFPDAHSNLAMALFYMGRMDEAEASCRRAIQLRPDFAHAHTNLSSALLISGKFEEGWKEHEWRWKAKHLISGGRDFTAPQWTGEPVGERTLLLHAEQGLGDTLQFCRYAPLVGGEARVILEVQAPLVRLLSRMPGVEKVIARGQPLPKFDLHCPLLSLPGAFGTTLESVPADIPYLSAEPVDAERWRTRLAGFPGLKVGLVWAGSARDGIPELAAIDARRSMALQTLAPLARIPGVSFISLQKGPPSAQAADPPGMVLTDFTAELSDFADTAALIEALDLVISVDTSVAHLAGAMGKPIWLLNRFDTCWRWMLGRDDSPWYPTLRQFRQPSPGDWDTVVEEVRQALESLAAGGDGRPRPEARPSIGEVFQQAVADQAAGRLQEAEKACREVLAMQSSHAEALHLLGVIAHQTGRYALARNYIRQAIDIDGEQPAFHRHLGLALCTLGRSAEAEASLRAALRLRPDFPEALNTLGIALTAQARPTEAEERYREALRLRPDFIDAHHNRGIVLLMAGRFEEAWPEYEWRWKTNQMARHAKGFSEPQWTGEPVGDRTLLLHAEQGLGDTLQFCRYAPLVGGEARVILEVQAPLVRLLSRMPGVEKVIARGQPLPEFDLHCPLLSLPRAFGTTLENIPADIPYLSADPTDAGKWRKRLAELPGLKVGLVWAGNPRVGFAELAAEDARRSMILKMLAPLARAPGVSLVSLQKGVAAAQAADPLLGMVLADFTAELSDFADTAALIEALDLVISVDTSVAHLAGAMGKPIWLLNRFDTCWRWMLSRDDSPWYPTLRQFRQPSPGDWDTVVEEARDALTRLAGGDQRPLRTLGKTSTRKGPRQRVAPESAQDLFAAGFAAHQAGRLQDAESAYRRVLAIDPSHAQAWNNLGAALYGLGRLADAEASYREAVRVRPDYADAHGNLGMTLIELCRPVEAEASYRAALRLAPELPSAINNLGAALFDQGKLAEARDAYREALRLQPDFPDAHVFLGIALLLDGRFEEGWREYEWRWRAKQLLGGGRDFTAPQWTGEPVGERTLLLHAEQGLGDTLQFCRYAPLVGGEARVILEVQAPLVRLLSRMPGVEKVIARGQPLPEFDLHCPLLSLPGAFGTTLASVPDTAPYLTADPGEAEAWRARLAELAGLKVGLVWAGSPREGSSKLAAVDARRSLSLERLAPLARIPGVSFISLQKGPPSAQAADPPPGMVLADFTAELSDFADTAALIEALDLVISVDTSVAHLAGAMGKPIWLLNRFDTCWRWMLGRDDSPWYPTLRQFRQPSPGDWDTVVEEVRQALESLAAEPLPSGQQGQASEPGALALSEAGLVHHQAGRLAQAQAAYDEALAAQPRHAKTLNLRAIIAHQAGRHEEALGYFQRAIAANGDEAEYRWRQGLALVALARPEEAEASYREAIRLSPGFAEAHNSLGIALAALGRPQEAEASYLEALKIRPDFADALNNLGSALYGLERHAEAEARYREALTARPDFPEALNNLGTALFALGRPAEAEDSYREALRHRPDFTDALTNLGQLLDEVGRSNEAEGYFKSALGIRPASPAIHNSLGVALVTLGRPAEAEAAHREALRLRPDFPIAYGNLGIALSDQGRAAEAEASYRQALRLRPDLAQTRMNLGYALLRSGRFEEGWDQHEWRWKTQQMSAHVRGFAAPLWTGEPLSQRTLLLHAEQGLGDTLQFCRYASLVGGEAKVILEVQAPLVRLLSRMPGVRRVVARGATVPAFDLHCPLLSLPRAFGTTLESIPNAVPYLNADPAQAEAWRDRLSDLPGIKVGLVWAGNPREGLPKFAAVDTRRSLSLEAFAPLAALAGVNFVSLQKGAAGGQAADPPPGMVLTDFTAELSDFADTAALIEALDLVISVDTSVAHLAGAMGKPIWLLNRFDTCWRWMLGRDDSPWYPTLRQFRQPSPGDWDTVVEEVRQALGRLAIGGDRRLGLEKAAPSLANPTPPIKKAAPLGLGRSAAGLFRKAFDHHQAGRFAEARTGCFEILAIDPSHTEALHMLGVIAHQEGHYERALDYLGQAIALKETDPSYHANLALVLSTVGRPHEAEESARTALRLRPEFVEALINLGNALFSLGRPAEADESYREALRLQPDSADTHNNRGIALLTAGRLEEGWEEQEWRWRTRHMADSKRNFAPPLWTGEPVGDRTLLLHAEQGLGDTLQFCRYAPLVGGEARIILEVQAPLVRLLSRMPGVEKVIARGQPLPPFDLHCPLLSLPRAFGTTLESVPADIPYLSADPTDAGKWRKRLAELPGLKVGLVWAGNPRQGLPNLAEVDARRSVALRRLAPLVGTAGISWVSLQKGAPSVQAADPPPGMVLADFTAELSDFADTAALIEALDLVISVDTSVAHLAGAMGKPIWLLNRFDTCWRWMLSRDDSPWYPTLRQFRQPSPGDWDTVIHNVSDALGRLAGGASERSGQASRRSRQKRRRA